MIFWSISSRPLLSHKRLFHLIDLVWDAFSSSLVSWFHPPETGLKNRLKDSLLCSPPRKSLVKGERFMRCEGKPECSKPQRGKPGQTRCITNVVLANFQSQMTVGCMRDTSALCTTRKMCWVICQILVESTLPLMQKRLEMHVLLYSHCLIDLISRLRPCCSLRKAYALPWM